MRKQYDQIFQRHYSSHHQLISPKYQVIVSYSSLTRDSDNYMRSDRYENENYILFSYLLIRFAEISEVSHVLSALRSIYYDIIRFEISEADPSVPDNYRIKTRLIFLS